MKKIKICKFQTVKESTYSEEVICYSLGKKIFPHKIYPKLTLDYISCEWKFADIHSIRNSIICVAKNVALVPKYVTNASAAKGPHCMSEFRME